MNKSYEELLNEIETNVIGQIKLNHLNKVDRDDDRCIICLEEFYLFNNEILD